MLAVVGKRAEHVRVYCQVCGDRVKRRLKLERRLNWIVVASGIFGLVVGIVWSLALGDLDSTWYGLVITGFALFAGLAGLAFRSPVRYVRRSELGSMAADI